MIWVGLLTGIFLGFSFESFPLGLLYTVLGGVIGMMLGRRRKQDAQVLAAMKQRLEHVEAQALDLAKQLESLRADKPAAAPVPAAAPLRTEQKAAQASPANQTVADSALTLLPATPAAPAPVEAIPQPVMLQPTAPAPVAAQPEAPLPAMPPMQTPATAPAPAAAKPAPQPGPESQPRPQSKPQPKPQPKPTPRQPSALELKLKQLIFGGNPLVKIGVLILFLGLGFLLRYASEYIVVPVELRYAGVAAAGVALLITGWRLRGRKDNYGLILQGAGVAVMYLTPLAAMRVSNLLPPTAGFAVLIVVAAFAALLAILQDSLAMAIAGTLGGFATPILGSTGHDAHLGLFLFLTVLNLGITAIAWFKAWRVLNLIGFASTFMLVGGWAAKFYAPSMFGECEPFLLLYFALYVLITVLFARRVLVSADVPEAEGFGAQIRRSAAQLNYVDGVLAFCVPVSTFALQYGMVQTFTYGAAFSALGFGLFYAALAMLLFRSGGRRYLLLSESLLALAVIFGSVAIPLGLDQAWTSAAWAIEAGGLYWIGLRQNRVHGRAFALLILLASALSSLAAMRTGDVSPALIAPTLGCLILAASAGWICFLARREKAQVAAWETAARPAVMAAGALFLALTPFTLFPMQWGSALMAVLGVALLWLGLRWNERLLQIFGWLYQAAAGALFTTTLHAAAGASALSSGGDEGFSALFLVSLIGTGMIASVWLAVQRWNAALARQDAPPQFGLVATIALLAGIVFLCLAPLFVLSLTYAVFAWSLIGLATVWWAVRMRHVAAMILAVLLQAAAGVGHVIAQFILPVFVSYSLDKYKPFMHSGFWGPVLISTASLMCARLLHRVPASGQTVRANLALGWIALAWAVIWWAFGWVNEIGRVFSSHGPATVIACMLALTMATALLWTALARLWNWNSLGQTTLLYPPALWLIACGVWASDMTHPLASMAALAWPAALAVHGVLLKQQENWLAKLAQQAAHVAGVWLFVTIAADELRWRFAGLGDATGAWPLLGWMIAPVAYLLLLNFKRIRHAWPLRAQPEAYVFVAAIPMALYLTAWVWFANLVSAGDAAPLPYVPVLNPLEIAQLAALLGIVLWWWPQRETLRGARIPFAMAGSATGLAILTGIVARTCHHWAGVAWDADALWQSTTFQTALSVAWGTVAICTMLSGNRRRNRWVWITGAVLMGVVVLKLFLVELAAHGSLARIVSFIVIGILLLVVGYFAPLPPRATTTTTTTPEESPAS
ncbi:MAG TPA: DUF2339 domain-containing protein [Burkholderiaceae bacterium]